MCDALMRIDVDTRRPGAMLALLIVMLHVAAEGKAAEQRQST
jgi:hypothetical protein